MNMCMQPMGVEWGTHKSQAMAIRITIVGHSLLSSKTLSTSEVLKVHMEDRRWHGSPHMTAAALSDVEMFRFTDKQGEVAGARAEYCSMKCPVKFKSLMERQWQG